MMEVAGLHPGSKPRNDFMDMEDLAVVSGRSSPIFAIFNFTKTMIGAGVFTAPHAMLISGYFSLIFFLIVATIVMYLTCRVIMHMGLRYNVHSYKAVCEKVLGRWGGIAESISSFLLTFGAMISYCLIISESLPPLLIQLTGHDLNCLYDHECEGSGVSVARVFLDKRIMLCMAGIVILFPLSILPDVHFLSYSSLSGLFCFLLIVVCLSQRALSLPDESKGTLTGGDLLSIVHPSGIANAISRSAFMNICQHAQFLIFNSLKKNTNKNRNIVIISSLSISTFFIILFGTLTYIPLNNKLTGNIFNSFSYDDTLVNVCRLALSLHIMASYPLQAHVCRVVPFNLFQGEDKKFTTRYRLLYSTIIFLLSWGIAMVVCDLGIIVDVTGGVAAGMLSFVLPSLLWMVVAYRDQVREKVKYIPCALLFIAGVALVVYTIVNEVITAVKSEPSNEVCVYKFL